MDALLMCGGPGSRLDADVEKPRFEVGGRPMVERVLQALDDSGVETTHAVVSPETPETRRALDRPIIEAPGDGYVADLELALDRVHPPVLTVATDLPLLAGEVVDAVLEAHGGGPESLAVSVPAAVKRALGVSCEVADDGLAPTGLNVVGPGDERTFVSHDVRLAVNVNRRSDAAVAEGLL